MATKKAAVETVVQDSDEVVPDEVDIVSDEVEVASPMRTVRMRVSGESLYGSTWYTHVAGERITVPADVAAYWVAHNMTYDN